ncbi:hypothetical protein GOB25_07555 [Sinorhizobium meliloti]|nr:hypothetical protein [Sinorhizobium meliloti]
MPTFKITGPDGKSYRVSGDNAEGAFQALQQHLGGSAQPQGESQEANDALGEMSAMTQRMGGELPGGNLAAARYEARPAWQKPLVAAADTADLVANGASFGFGNKLAAGLRAPFTDKTYAEELEGMRAHTDRARDRAGSAGTVAELAGAIMGPVAAAGKGLTLTGRLGTGAMGGAKGLAARSGLMSVEGAGYGALTAAGNDQDIAEGAGFGFVGGALGNVAGEGLSALGQKASRAWGLVRATPEERAAGQIYEAAQRIGSDDALRRLDELGPEAMAIDVLGKRGTALARKASNLSPEAREVLESSLLGRKAGQNARVVSDIEGAAGLPAGNRLGVEDLKAAQFEKLSPEINKAYQAARELGFDLDTDAFDDLLSTPMGREAWKKSLESVQNRAPFQPKIAMQEAGTSVRDGNNLASGRSISRALNQFSPKPGAMPKKPQGLAEFVARRGGVKDQGGELGALDLSKTKIGRNRLVSENGEDLDRMREAAAQAGYFNHLYGTADDAAANSTVADLLDLLDQDIRGGGTYSQFDDALAFESQQYDDLLAERRRAESLFSELGSYIPKGTPDDAVIRAAKLVSEGRAAPDDALRQVEYEDFLEFGAQPRDVPSGLFPGENVRQYSNLSRLDQMKRALDSKSKMAARAGDNTTASEATALARELRTRMDSLLDDPVYANARALRQEAFKTDEAFDLGADLASGRVPFGLPQKAKSVADTDRDFMAKGYAARQSENLLNKGSTEGALNSLSTPMAREAMEAALGSNAQSVINALARERAFNAAARDVTGNSTTTRQLMEMLGTGTGVGGAAMLFGYDPTTSGVAGFLAGAMKRGAPALARKIATETEKKAAPHLAEILTRRQLPTSRPIQEGALERLSKSKREALARMIMGIGAHNAGTPAR